MDPAIQIVVNARVDSVKDEYMDDAALFKLKNDLLHDTAGERVEATIVDDTLTASVWVLGQEYTCRANSSSCAALASSVALACAAR